MTSKLANPSAQRAEQDGALLAHILSIVATAGINDRDGISRFLSKTFLASQTPAEAWKPELMTFYIGFARTQ